jgi:RND family efflux transporter MFP subunit
MTTRRTLTISFALFGTFCCMTAGSAPAEAPATDTAAELARIEAFTEPYRDVAVAAGEMGTVATIEVGEGDIVSADSVLATLDNRVLQASLQVAMAGATAKGPLESAIAEVERLKHELEQLTLLQSRNHASQREVDRTRTQLRVAECRVQTVREELEVRELETKRIQAQLEQRIVRSPIAGTVTEIRRQPGEFVSLTDTVVVRVVQLDPLLIVFLVPLERRDDVRRDERVMLQVGHDNRVAEGIVEYVSPTVDPSNTAIRVKVRLPNANGKWRAGEPVALLLDGTGSDAGVQISPLASRAK